MRARVIPILLCAAATAGAGELFDERVALLGPFPRTVARGKRLEIEGGLVGRYRVPELILIAPDGTTCLNKDNVVTGAEFVFRVAFERGPGPYRIEIMARTSAGYATAARFTVHYASKPPSEEKEPPPPEGAPVPRAIHERLVEKRLLGLLNDFRASLRLRPVGWNEGVAARAREHAARMAKSGRAIHEFGRTGIVEMLTQGGAGGDGSSGPGSGWQRVDSVRPFAAPAPGPPGPRLFNRVVVFVLEATSLDRVFEAHFVREAAWRLVATDPHALEAAVGAARHPKNRAMLYLAVCIVQINDVTIIAGQDRAYQDALAAAERRDPDALRGLGIWGRPPSGLKALHAAFQDGRPEIAAAAFDGWLLLDEKRAREELGRAEKSAEAEVANKEYGRAADIWRRFHGVAYDADVARSARRREVEANLAAARELGEIRALTDPGARKAALASLLRRASGLPAEKQVAAASADVPK
ncbi:MAG: CAP domain-containing protein [Planctomycetota bacterium]